jgi:hypothetical protein
MLTEGEVRVLIVKRLMAACDSCNSYHINHVEGQIRGLLAVLNDGKKFDSDGDCRRILEAAGIPWEPHPKDENGWRVPDEWFAQHGATVNGDDVDHPKLTEW